jgi:cytoskeletal protein CcmA (bactofilin family)
MKGPETRYDYTFIGESCTIEGSLDVKGEVVVNGTVEGTVRCDTLLASQGSRIKGRIKARNATISGVVESEVNVSEHLAIMKSGKLTGSVSYGSLSIEPGGVLKGKCMKLDAKSTKVVVMDGIENSSASS